MQLLVYVYHPDATSLLVEELTELEDAVALCHELVAVDGYVRAEVWNEAGELRHGVERLRGGSLRAYGDPVDAEDRATPAVLHDRAVDMMVTSEPAAAEPRGTGVATRPAILGERPDQPELWFGS